MESIMHLQSQFLTHEKSPGVSKEMEDIRICVLYATPNGPSTSHPPPAPFPPPFYAASAAIRASTSHGSAMNADKFLVHDFFNHRSRPTGPAQATAHKLLSKSSLDDCAPALARTRCTGAGALAPACTHRRRCVPNVYRHAYTPAPMHALARTQPVASAPRAGFSTHVPTPTACTYPPPALFYGQTHDPQASHSSAGSRLHQNRRAGLPQHPYTDSCARLRRHQHAPASAASALAHDPHACQRAWAGWLAPAPRAGWTDSARAHAAETACARRTALVPKRAVERTHMGGKAMKEWATQARGGTAHARGERRIMRARARARTWQRAHCAADGGGKAMKEWQRRRAGGTHGQAAADRQCTRAHGGQGAHTRGERRVTQRTVHTVDRAPTDARRMDSTRVHGGDSMRAADSGPGPTHARGGQGAHACLRRARPRRTPGPVPARAVERTRAAARARGGQGCTNPHQSNRVYFHRFPPVPAPANMVPPSLHSQPPPAPLAASSSLATASTYSASERMTCSAPGCMSSRLDTGCCRLMCRKHCNQVGPCALKAHERERVRKSQTAALPTAVPPAQTAAPAPAPTSGAHRRLVDDASHDDWVWSQTTTSSPPPASGARRPHRSIASTLPFTDYSSLDDWFTQTLPPVLALEARQQQCNAETSFLDELPGVKSPTPETESIRERYEREEREDAARLELGLRLSQDQTGAGPSRAPSPHPASTLFLASPPSPRPLSSSPDFPDSLLPLVSHKGKARATKTRPAPAPLRITTQMNSDWMSPSPPTFHVKKKAPASTRSFVVVYWVRPNVAHRTFVIEDVPAWLRWRICEATGRFAELLGNGAHVELYFPKFTSWVEVTPTFVHTVTTDCVVMLHRAGVDCLDLERTICKFYPQTDVVHIRKNLPGERTALRRMYKHGRTIPMDDSDVEVVSEKKRIKTEDDVGDELPRRQRPRLHIEVDDVVIVDDADSLSTPALTTTSSISTPSSSSAPSPALSCTSLPTTTAIRWPTGVHVTDMVAGFRTMDSPELAMYDREERFKRAFRGYAYHASTVTKHRAIYRSVTRAEVKKGVDATWTKEGLWSIWRKTLAANANSA
ncbi:hypothetical protein GGX14DRAFT_700800 [Mycena pura]|uniref:Uncharacterized protein n=1 Tax=Mycena pura TaxID=153505 RepID=A0AAD6UUA4_9AGAR|nr:hypothetical protein GGX14DRAFT_700800 [Mycena pura]